MIGKILIIPLVLAILAVIWFGRGTFLSQINPSSTATPTITQTLIPVSTIVPTIVPTVAPTPTPSVPSGWQTYTNTQYGFSISFPATYKALSDKENLYGWPNGIVLIYSGGQAYDIAIEVWTTEDGYKLKYPTENLAVYKIDGKFITLADQTKSAENQAIIDTFQLTK